MSKVAIVGAGASGIIAALKANENNEVILIDSNDKCGKKILLTGSGRCNYWNEDISITSYETDDKDGLENILSDENKSIVLKYLDNLGIYPKIKNGYYYPYSNSAISVREILQREIEKSNINFRFGFKVKNILKQNNKFTIISEDGENIVADKVIIATGSKAYPKTGSDGLGYEFARRFGHTINDVTPALTQLITTKEKFLKDWENIRCNAKVTLFVNNKKVKEDTGEIQLTKNGVSGICVFNISGLASKNLAMNNKVNIEINFLPDIENGFYSWFSKRADLLKERTVEELLESIFNYKLMFVILKKAGIPKGRKWSQLSEKDKLSLTNTIEKFDLYVEATESFEKSQVCTGGVSLKEINPLTMESKLVPNLYFAGEVLDVDGKCGGFNLAFAWTSGYLAGRGV